MFGNHYCRGKAQNTNVCACLCTRAHVCVPGRVSLCMRVRAYSLAYPACNAYALYCDVIWPLWLDHIFRHYLINDTIFEKQLLNIKCVF
jgi:hypothetical protein